MLQSLSPLFAGGALICTLFYAFGSAGVDDLDPDLDVLDPPPEGAGDASAAVGLLSGDTWWPGGELASLDWSAGEGAGCTTVGTGDCLNEEATPPLLLLPAAVMAELPVPVVMGATETTFSVDGLPVIGTACVAEGGTFMLGTAPPTLWLALLPEAPRASRAS